MNLQSILAFPATIGARLTRLWLGCALVVAVGLGHGAPVQAAPLQVVASLPSLAALAAEVGGDVVEVRAMASPRQDPHFVDARPDLILQLARADLLLVNGLGLESGWVPALLAQARNPKILAGGRGHFEAARFVSLLQVTAGPVDRTQGDIHRGGNPHFLSDPRAGAKVALALAETLASLHPAQAAAVRARATALAGRLEALAAQESARFAKLPAARRALVAYHESLPYLLTWLGIRQIATLEPRPGIPPHPQHVASVLGLMRQQAARVIAQEEYYPRSTSQTVARMAGARLAVLHGGARFAEGERYEAHVRGLAKVLYDAFAQ